MAPRSAAMLIVLATKSKSTTAHMTGAGKLRQTFPAMPWPVTRPMRAEISWIATIRGYVRSIVQPMPKPSCAPA